MATYREVYDRMTDTVLLLSPFYRKKVATLLHEHGYPDNWFVLNAVHANEPDPFALDDYHLRVPYVSLKHQAEIFANLATAGFLECRGTTKYILTEKGRQLIEGFFKAAHESLSEIDLLPESDSIQFVELLDRLVEAVNNQPEPAEKLAFNSSRRTDPGNNYPALVLIDQYITDLIAFRDDAHTAAWQPYGLNGRTWESLTLIWREEADSAASLSTHLSFRGYSEDEYNESIQELRKRGWLTIQNGKCQISDEGRQIREEAEAETDHLFFTGWSVLNDDELSRLNDLLTRSNERLEEASMALFWPWATELAEAIPATTQSLIQETSNKYFVPPTTFFPTLLASGRFPKSYTVADHTGRFPYINPDRVKNVLSEAVEIGLLASSNGGYLVTEKGRESLNTLNDIFYRRLDEITSILEVDVQELADLLQRIVEASLQAAEPGKKSALIIMHNCHPEFQYGPLAKIDQHLDDLNAFRDVCHIAAWKPYEVDARSWETFTFVWRADATSASELAEKLPFRGYEEADYAHSLNNLVERGWIEERNNRFQITKTGQLIREEAEIKTNRFFYRPWECLSQTERNRLRELLIRTRLELQDIAEAQNIETA